MPLKRFKVYFTDDVVSEEGTKFVHAVNETEAKRKACSSLNWECMCPQMTAEQVPEKVKLRPCWTIEEEVAIYEKNREGFKDFDWDYEKEFYDVLLPSWEIVMWCWPNAWFINECKWEHREWAEWECKIRKDPNDGLWELWY